MTRQLQRIAALARLLLLAQRLLQWLAVMGLIVLLAGLLDFGLRLPGWLRLVVGGAVVIGSISWLVWRLVQAMRFSPGLAELALRAERLYPELGGLLATAVEFATHPARYARSPMSQRLVQASIEQARQKTRNVRLRQLLDPSHTLQQAVTAGVILAVLLAVIVLAPGHSLLAAQRWMWPLGDVQWPRRTQIDSLVRDTVWPADTPLRLGARVDRGLRPAMRTWATYRWVDAHGQAWPWQSVLMSQQTQTIDPRQAADGVTTATVGTFETLLDVAGLLADGQLRLAAAGPGWEDPGFVEFYFEAGDNQTPIQRMQLVARPALQSLTVRIDPPAYARGLVSSQQVQLDQQAGSVAGMSALTGSYVEMTLRLNKPLPESHVQISSLLPGLAGVQGLAGSGWDVSLNTDSLQGSVDDWPRVVVGFYLNQTVQSRIVLEDEHGLTNQSERLYRLEATADHPPTVTMTQPVADEAVLPTAVVDVAAVGQDDVAVSRLTLHARLPAGRGETADDSLETLARTDGRQSRLSVGHELDLSAWSLHPGDEVSLLAIVQDVYDLDGQQHDPVRSSPRRLRIIDAAAMISQLRSELAAMRQQALRLEDQQRQISEQPPRQAQLAQQQLTDRLAAQRAMIESLVQRMQRNRLDEPAMTDLLGRVADLLEQADQASRQAAEELGRAQQPDPQAHANAQRQQQQVRSALTDLAQMLDQGRDAVTLQLQLQQLAAQQETLSLDTRQMLPRTLGQDAEKLSPEDQAALRELAQRQAALSQRAEALAQQMQHTAAALAGGNDPADGSGPEDQAAAQALAEAAAIAQRQGLAQQMQQAAGQIDENRLAGAGDQQSQAQQTLQDMLQQMGRQNQIRQEMLRRRLMQLADALRQMIQRQQQQIDALQRAQALGSLEQPMTVLRQNTMALADQAAQSPQTAPAAEPINRAVEQQGQAIVAIRQDQRESARAAEQLALEHLEEALKQVLALQQQAQDQQLAQQREDLRQAYEKLANQQDALRQVTEPIALAQQITRRQRGELIDLGDQQEILRTEIQQLQEQVETTLTFQHLHDRIDRALTQTVTRLRTGQADGQVVRDQTQAVLHLRQMAQALAEAQQDDPFASGPQGGGGGGGGSGGESGDEQGGLVPQIAELRLLRSLQQAVHDHTRQLHDQTAALDHGLLEELVTQQHDLASLGEQLMQAVRKQAAPSQPGEEP